MEAERKTPELLLEPLGLLLSAWSREVFEQGEETSTLLLCDTLAQKSVQSCASAFTELSPSFALRFGDALFLLVAWTPFIGTPVVLLSFSISPA